MLQNFITLVHKNQKDTSEILTLLSADHSNFLSGNIWCVLLKEKQVLLTKFICSDGSMHIYITSDKALTAIEKKSLFTSQKTYFIWRPLF